MKILMVCTPFPPYNNIGGVRTGKMAKYLHRAGHDLRVITLRNQPKPVALHLEIPLECVTYAPWFSLDAAFRPTAGRGLGGLARGLTRGLRPLEDAVASYAANPIDRPGPTTGSPGPSAGSHARPAAAGGPRKRRGLRRHLGALASFPDPLVGWYPFACRAALRISGDWRPDVIYASSPGPTGLLVAHAVAARLGVPWVAEFRDLWMDHPAQDWPGWRQRLGERLERTTLSTAEALVAVSEPAADLLRRKFGRDTFVVTNGFDPADFPARPVVPFRDGSLRIVHTGELFAGGRTPALLFAALCGREDLTRRIRVAFYGSPETLALAGSLARAHGVAAVVELIPSIPYRESLRVQSEADVLLLPLWDDPKVRGWHSGKFFEYIGARRPILATGPATDVDAEVIRARRLGVVLDDPAQVARLLEEWVRVKAREGFLPSPPAEAAAGFTREELAGKLESVLLAVAGPPAGARSGRS
ncbi:MAG: glycosyltransferase [bacterium]